MSELKLSPTCLWAFDEDHGFYATTCEGAFCLESGSPAENHYIFCPKCGYEIQVVPMPDKP